MRVALLTIVLAFASAALPVSAQAVQQSYHLNIPREPLDGALKDLAQQTGLQIARFSDTPGGSALVGPVSGEMSVGQALTSLLEKSGLTYKVVNDRTIAVVALSTEPTPSTLAVPASESSPTTSGEPQKEGKKSSSDTFRVAQVDQGQAAGSPPVGRRGAQTAGSEPGLQEVVVTAQKRAENLLEVPVPVTAISAQSLLDTNRLRLQDYYTSIPGLSVTPSDFGAPQLTIRGLTTGGFTSPTVGVTVDDVPYGSSSSLASGQEAPDLDPSDLARVEVLRGPQGTLYGASSIGGLIKFVTLDPSTDAVSGRVQAGVSGVQNGAETGYGARGAVNLPLSDSMAVRASAFMRLDPGYIDNVFTGQRGINETRADGGRLSWLWRSSDDLSLKLSALVQHFAADGSDQVVVQSGLSGLQQNFVRGAGTSNHDIQAYSAVLTAKVGGLNLTSLTGYSVNRFSEPIDYTSILGPFTQNGVPGTGFNGFGVPGTQLISHVDTGKFTEEVRLSSPVGNRIEWLLGAFYNHEDSPSSEDLLASQPLTGAIVGSWAHISDPSTFSEYAAFTDVTFHFTERFDIQVGGRESENRQSFSENFTGPYAPIFLGQASPVQTPVDHTKDNSFTYLVTPRLKLSQDVMVYARFASGYRPGGPNVSTGAFVPPHFNPDTTRNYELGIKGDLLDRALTFDASLYYIDWKNIQLQLINPQTGVEYFANGSAAKSQGLELSLQSKPLAGMTVSAWVTWNDAVLTEALPASSTALGNSGDRLPYSSRFSGNLSLDEEFAVTGRVTGFVGGSASYLGDREGVFLSVFAPSSTRQDLPAYARFDLRGGARYNSWAVNLYVNNLADKRGVLIGGVGTTLPSAFTYIQPRTVGILVSKTF